MSVTDHDKLPAYTLRAHPCSQAHSTDAHRPQMRKGTRSSVQQAGEARRARPTECTGSTRRTSRHPRAARAACAPGGHDGSGRRGGHYRRVGSPMASSQATPSHGELTGRRAEHQARGRTSSRSRLRTSARKRLDTASAVTSTAGGGGAVLTHGPAASGGLRKNSTAVWVAAPRTNARPATRLARASAAAARQDGWST